MAPVYRDPWADEQHRGAGGADDIAEQCATQQKGRIHNGEYVSFINVVGADGESLSLP